MGYCIHSPSASSMDTSMWLPSPVLARKSSADWMLVNAYMPAAMSAIELPALLGVSGVPVMDRKPASD